MEAHTKRYRNNFLMFISPTKLFFWLSLPFYDKTRKRAHTLVFGINLILIKKLKKSKQEAQKLIYRGGRGGETVQK